MSPLDKDGPTVADACPLHIGSEVIEIYGDAESGWSIACDGLRLLPACYRYQSIDELIFALANLAVTTEGEA